MKINAPLFTDFIRKASLDGEIPWINLNFKEEGLHSRVRDIVGIALTDTLVPREQFEDYEAIGEIYVRDTSRMKKYLDTFGGMVNIEFPADGIMKLSDLGREVLIILGSADVIDNAYRKDLPEVDTTATLNVTKDSFSRTIKDLGLTNNDIINISADNGKLTLQLGKPDKMDTDAIVNTITSEGEGVATVGVGKIFINFYNVVGENFSMKFANDSPVCFTQNDEEIQFTCIIAPRVE